MDKEEDNTDLRSEQEIISMVKFFGFVLPCLSFIFLFGSVSYNRAMLITDGIVDTGIVVLYHPSTCGSSKSPRTCHYHQISVKNLGLVSLDLGREFKLSSPVTFTYQKDDKSNARVGNVTSLESLNFSEIFDFILLIICFLFFSFLFKNFIKAFVYFSSRR